MHLSNRVRLSFCVALALFAAATVNAAEGLVSSMKIVSAVTEMSGYAIQPAFEFAGIMYAGDEAPSQSFEVTRPGDGPVTLGRLFTSCSCIRLETPQKQYQQGERIILTLRNVKPTPHDGKVYQIFVQLSSPVRTTLRYNVFVQSERFLQNHMVTAVPAQAHEIATVKAEATEVQTQ